MSLFSSFTFPVSADNIAFGKRQDAEHCALALAWREQFGGLGSVETASTFIGFDQVGNQWGGYCIGHSELGPWKLPKWVTMFDEGREVSPGTVELWLTLMTPDDPDDLDSTEKGHDVPR